MAQIGEWGPHIWLLLHSCAERAGSAVTPMDEVQAWIRVLRLTEGALPCAMCREHYRGWRLSHPLEDFLLVRGDAFKETVRQWLWGLHESVNKKREIPEADCLPYDNLQKYRQYNSQDIHQSFTTLMRILEKAILHRQVNPVYVTDWRRAIAILRRLINY